jgi:hypothetical protein
MSGIHTVEYKRREFSDEVGWCFPYVCLVAVRDCDVSEIIEVKYRATCNILLDTHFPSGLKAEARTFALKLM